MATVSATTARSASSQVRSIVIAGLVIGVLGGLDQVTFYTLTQHLTPMLVFQYIASGLLGMAAFAGGYTTALLGLVIHFVISFVVAGVFILAASKITFPRRALFLSALVYGAAVFLFMGVLVVPFSAAPKMSVSTLALVHGLIADAVLVGLPPAIMVWQSARARRVSGIA